MNTATLPKPVSTWGSTNVTHNCENAYTKFDQDSTPTWLAAASGCSPAKSLPQYGSAILESREKSILRSFDAPELLEALECVRFNAAALTPLDELCNEYRSSAHENKVHNYASNANNSTRKEMATKNKQWTQSGKTSTHMWNNMTAVNNAYTQSA